MAAEAPRTHATNPSALPVGTRLGEFELLSLLGVGGFGIVYLAFDHALEREVAVKEYLPASLAGRTETMHVTLRSQSDAETFALGLKSFVNEARLLARFDHPSLLKVHRFWESNGTAYMAMPVLRGRTLKDVRQELAGPPDETWLRALLAPLLGAIEKLHSEGVYHRDIAPDNIQIEPDGHPVLLDFGAARRVLSDRSQALTAILKPAYAPIEQYAEAGAVKQGPWTDLYALGATLHYVLMARPPAPATARAIHDEASTLTPAALPGCSESFLHTIDWMLAPRPIDRPQSVAALREVLDGRAAVPVRRPAPAPTVSDWERTVLMPASTAAATAAPNTSARQPAQQPPTALDIDPTVVWTPSRGPEPSTDMAVPVAVFTHDAAEPEAGRRDRRAPPAAAPAAQQAVPVAPVRSKLLPVAMGKGKGKVMGMGVGVGALVLVAVAAVLLARKLPPAPAALPAVAASSAPAEANAKPPAAPPTAAVAESAIATVVVPPQAAVAMPTKLSLPAPEHSANTTVPAQPEPSMTTKAAAAAPKPTAAASGRNLASGAVASASPVVVVAAPPPEPARPKAEAQPPPILAPLAPALAEAQKPTVNPSPEAVCGGKNPLLYFICMEKECLRSEQLGTADCKKWRAGAKREQ